jgi:hypothetical protein
MRLFLRGFFFFLSGIDVWNERASTITYYTPVANV